MTSAHFLGMYKYIRYLVLYVDSIICMYVSQLPAASSKQAGWMVVVGWFMKIGVEIRGDTDEAAHEALRATLRYIQARAKLSQYIETWSLVFLREARHALCVQRREGQQAVPRHPTLLTGCAIGQV